MSNKPALKTTGSLSSLVSRMSDQLKLSEESTSTLIHSSALLRETEGEFASMGSHIQVLSISHLFLLVNFIDSDYR